MIEFPKQKHIPARGKTAGERAMDALKMFGVIVAIFFVPMFLLAPLSMILIVAGILFVLFVVPGYIITNIGTNWLHQDDPHYQEYREAGGQPYLDGMHPWKDSSPDYKLPYEEPSYTDFVPPRSWAYQCLTCFARVEQPSGQCWNCGIRLKPRKKRFPLD